MRAAWSCRRPRRRPPPPPRHLRRRRLRHLRRRLPRHRRRLLRRLRPRPDRRRRRGARPAPLPRRPVSRAPSPGFQIGAGPIVALVGGLLYFVASWLAWLRFAFSGTTSVTQSFSAYDIPAHFLLDSQSESGGLSLGLVIAFFGFACLAAAVLSDQPQPRSPEHRRGRRRVPRGRPLPDPDEIHHRRAGAGVRDRLFLGPAVRGVHRLLRRHRVDRRRHPHIGAEEVVTVAFDDMQGEQ